MNQLIRVLSNTKALIILAIVFIVSFFTVPYLFPPKEMVESMSYDYGFNNQVGVLLVGLSILVFGTIGYLRNNINLNIFIKESEKLTFHHFVYGIIICLIFFVCALLCGEFVLNFNDSNYFYYHFYEMTLGRIPYKDFAFGYGPLTLYLPYWFYSLVPDISPLHAYVISLSLFHLLGLYGLFELINAMNISRTEKIWMFWIGFMLFFPYTLGMNYQAFRYVFPFWTMWRFHIVRPWWKLFLQPFAVLITLAFSPEIGLVYWIASIIYCGLQLYVSHNRLFFYVIVLTLLVNVCFVITFLPMFVFVLSFGTGFYNLPFIPSLHLLVFFLSIFVAAYYIVGGICQLEKYILEISILILAFGLIPACLGRCDPGHVVYNGFFLLSFSIILIIRLKGKYSLPLLCLVLIISVICSLAVGFRYLGIFPAAICNNANFIHEHKTEILRLSSCFKISTNVMDDKIELLFMKYGNPSLNFPISVNETILPKGKKVTMPFFLNSRDYYYLCSKGKIDEMYFTRSSCIGTNDVHKVVNELQTDKPRFLLLYRGWGKVKDPMPFSLYNNYVRELFFTYYPVKPRRNGNIVNKPLIDYIMKNFKVIDSDNNYLVYERIN